MTQRRVFGLDLLRAGAILLVLALHAAHAVKTTPHGIASLLGHGWIGVDLFFVLSGYLISSQAFANLNAGVTTGSALADFWKRRWTRTLPLYFVVLFTYTVVKPALFAAPFVGFSPKFFFFFQNLGPLQDFAQSWSLCIEEQFYLVFPLLVFSFRPRTAWVWLIPVGLSVLMRAYTWQAMGLPWYSGAELAPPDFDFQFRFKTLSHLDGIALGVFLGATRLTWSRWSMRLRHTVGILGAALVALTVHFTWYSPADFRAVPQFLFLALGFAGMVVAWCDLKTPARWFALPIQKIALWSYGAYLWNNLFIRLFDRYPIPGHWLIGSMAFFALTFVISALTYHLVELPGMGLRSLRLVANTKRT